jgi:hypothetical protein
MLVAEGCAFESIIPRVGRVSCAFEPMFMLVRAMGKVASV